MYDTYAVILRTEVWVPENDPRPRWEGKLNFNYTPLTESLTHIVQCALVLLLLHSAWLMA